MGLDQSETLIVRLIPAVTIDSPAELTIEAAMQPLRAAKLVEDYLFDMHGERIGWGALARLHGHIDAPYANPKLVAGFRGAFDQAINEEKHRQGIGNNKPRLRTGNDAIP